MRPLPTKNRLLVAILAITMGSISLAPNAVQAQWPYTTDVSPTYSVELGARLFDRPGDEAGLPLATNSVTNAVVFDSEQATDLNNAAGVDLRVLCKGPKFRQKCEFRTILADFDLNSEFTGPNLSLGLLPAFSPDLVQYQYNSRFLSFEWNARRPVSPGLTLLAGPRFVSVDEDVTTSFEQEFSTPIGPFVAEGATTIETVNSMYGGQIGFEYNMPISQSIYISTMVKAGGFANPTRVTQIDTNNVDPDAVINTASKNTGTFLGEINARVYCEIFPSAFSIYVGYDAMWIDGIALAPPQFLTVDPLANVDTTNTPFFQSISFGGQLQY